MNFRDYMCESLETIFWLKIRVVKFFDVNPDPGSGIRNLFYPGPGIRDGRIRIRDKHPGSATLLTGIAIVVPCKLSL
jgi:hypothetical protein